MKKKIDKPIIKVFGEKGNSFSTTNKPIEIREIIKPREAFTVHGTARSNHNSPEHEKSTSQYFSQLMNHYKYLSFKRHLDWQELTTATGARRKIKL